MEGKGNNAVVIVEVEKAVLPKIIQDNIIHMIHTAGLMFILKKVQTPTVNILQNT